MDCFLAVVGFTHSCKTEVLPFNEAAEASVSVTKTPGAWTADTEAFFFKLAFSL